MKNPGDSRLKDALAFVDPALQEVVGTRQRLFAAQAKALIHLWPRSGEWLYAVSDSISPM